MKRLIPFILILICCYKGLTQNNLLFSKFKFDSSYQIIGLCPYTDDSKQYKSLTFIIKDTLLLKKLNSQITYGNTITKPETEENSLEIYIVRDKKIVEEYSISPKYKHIYFYLNDSTPITADFNFEEILKVSTFKNFGYNEKSLKFDSVSEFEKFLVKNKSDKKFLCYQDNTEEYEGKFYIKVDKTEKNSIDSIWESIKVELKRISLTDKDFLIGYIPNTDNLQKLTFSINTSKKVYDKFNLVNYPKGKWTNNPIEILAYWTK